MELLSCHCDLAEEESPDQMLRLRDRDCWPVLLGSASLPISSRIAFVPTVEHDSGQVYQVVLNLLLNALQAIDGAGTIRVEISLLKGDAAITVMDTGRGIAPEHLPNIFRPFYTTSRNGTGLGLSLARRTAEEHHGRIEVTSEVGKWTKFLVVLPLQQATAQGEAA